MTTFATGQPSWVGARVEPAPLPHLSVLVVALFFASLGLLIGGSVGLGFLLGRASSWSVPVGPAPAKVAQQLSTAGGAKTGPQIELIPPSKLKEVALARTVDLPGTAPVSRALSPNVGAKKNGAEADELLAGAIQQPVTFEERTSASILNAASDPTERTPLRNSQHWLKLAEEVRLQAEEATQASGKRLLLKIAETYERLAQLTTIRCHVGLASCRRWIALEEQRARLSRNAPQ
jgi:hypothetical protein